MKRISQIGADRVTKEWAGNSVGYLKKPESINFIN